LVALISLIRIYPRYPSLLLGELGTIMPSPRVLDEVSWAAAMNPSEPTSVRLIAKPEPSQ